ncbi:MAG TPA: hypothetical protein VGE59_04360 [Patescibacteria group bacterium]
MSQLLFATIFTFLFPAIASAHGIGEVYKLPVPLHYYLAGAGVAVAVSFFALGLFFNKPSSGKELNRIVHVPWLSSVLKGGRVLAVLLLLLTIATGAFGADDLSKNFAPTFFWVYFLIGFSILSALIGNLWDKLNPWKTLAYATGLPRKTGKQVSGWVGVVLLLGLFWLELVSGKSFIPSTVGLALLGYSWFAIVFSRFYDNWYTEGELFSVLYGFIGKLAFVRISDDNTSLILTNPYKGTKAATAHWWTLGLASVLLAGASFDSLKESTLWFDWIQALGFTGSTYKIADTLGLILAPIPFYALYLAAIGIMRKLMGNTYDFKTLAYRFVWSLIPIAFGYTLAHNFSLTIVAAPSMLAFLSDPFGFGWNLFGTADFAQTNLLLGAKAVWFTEIGFIVAAHIAGVWFAHVVAMHLFPNTQQATKSQYPMLLLMVGYTVMTLWLLSQPIVVR